MHKQLPCLLHLACGVIGACTTSLCICGGLQRLAPRLKFLAMNAGSSLFLNGTFFGTVYVCVHAHVGGCAMCLACSGVMCTNPPPSPRAVSGRECPDPREGWEGGTLWRILLFVAGLGALVVLHYIWYAMMLRKTYVELWGKRRCKPVRS
jgi:hypothetical protein